MKICKHCGEENPDNKNWCKKCMKPLRDDSAEALPLSTEKVTSDKPAKSGIIRKVSDDPGKMSKSEDGFDKTEIENHCRIYGSMGPKNRSVSEEKAEKEESEQEDTSGLKGRIGRKEYGRGGSNSRIIRPPQRYCTRCSTPVDGEDMLCPKCRNRRKKAKTICLRVVAALLVVSMWSGLAVYFVGNRTPKVKNAEQASSVLKDLGEEWGYENAFSELTEKNTTTIDDDNYYRLQQNYKGIPVYGQTVVYATDENEIATSIVGNTLDVDENISLEPKVTAKQVENAIKTYCTRDTSLQGIGEIKINELVKDQLHIYIVDGKSQLVYIIPLGFYQFVVSAIDCEILECNQTIQSEYVSADGYTASDLSTSFSVAKGSDNYYVMKNLESGHTVYTLEGKNSDVVGIGENVTTLIKSADNVFGNNINERRLEHEKAALLLVNMDKVYEYFREFDFYTKTGTINLYYNDAYCSGLNARAAVLGSGDCAISIGSERDLNSFDMLGHEYTHLVSRTIINWRSSSEETTAISEGLSDVFGEFIEQACTNKECDWINDFRNIIDPSSNGYPAKVTDPNNSGEDFSHSYSTVISHAAYLMCNGIDGNDTKKINVNKLAELWYRAMLTMPSDCDFAQCRTLVELAASSMDLSVSQLQCVSEAFDKVGIPRASGNEYSQLVHYWEGDSTAIKGVVYEIKAVDDVETITPISEAIITVYDPVTGNNYRQISMNDADGFFEIDLEADRNYFVSFEAEGYITETISFNLSEHEVQYFSIAMEPTEEETPAEESTQAPAESLKKENILSGKCGDNLTWTLENGVLTISGTGAMYDYDPFGLSTDASAAPAPWYDYGYNNEITAIQIGDGVTYIGSYAFLCCWNIDNIRIPGNVKEIGECAFENCCNNYDKKLNVVIENGVEIIGHGAFFQCFTMMPIELPDSITYIGDAAFFGCYLENIIIPPNVKYIGDQLFVCDEDNHMEEIRFTGDAPVFAENTFLCTDAIAYYPANNKTWTNALLKDYGGNITWVRDKSEEPLILGSFKTLSEAYIRAISSKPNDIFSYGMLEDIDNDGTEELILGYCDSVNVDGTKWAAHCYSIYDYENKKLICIADKDIICFEVAGNSGRIGIVNYKNKPILMLKQRKAPNGTSGDLFKNCYTLFDMDTYQTVQMLRVDEHNEGNIWYQYYVDNSEVTQDEFEKELKNYKYLALNSKGRVDYSYPEKSFDELKAYLTSLVEPQTGMDLAAYKPILEKAMKNSGYDANDEYTRSYCEGILVDLDGDNVKELVLKHFDTDSPAAGGAERLLSVYDYENNKVVTRLDKASFGEFGFGGSYGYASVVYRDGKAFPVTYYEVGETSADASIGANMLGVMTVYDGENCKKLHSYRIDRDNGVISCEIDGKAVSERDFINHVEQYEGIKVVCDVYELIKLPDTFITAADLMKQLK